jgi:hypothetical protein
MKTFLRLEQKYRTLIIAILLIFVTSCMWFRCTLSENFETHPTLDNIPSTHSYDMQKMHETCNGLSGHACNTTNFCVLINGDRCVGGDKKGPTYNTQDGKDIDIKYYYHNGSCSGSCPSEIVK